jgi:hypothetical protein
MKLVGLLSLLTTSCAVASGTMMTTPAIMALIPSATVSPGEGSIGDAAEKRLLSRRDAALATATRDAVDAAAQHPDDLRLQRRAAAMVRTIAANKDARALIADLDERAGALLDRLARTTPCPGLVDAGATWVSLGDDNRAGDSYVRAASQCTNVEAAVAAVTPLDRAGRCDDAIAALRAAWPHTRGANNDLAIAVLDGVTSCSTAITLRRNLSFASPDVVEDYFALLEARRLQRLEDQRRIEAARREEEAQQRAYAARSSCESECSAAVSSCSSSCSGDSSCNQRCYSIGHVCRAGCGGY